MVRVCVCIQDERAHKFQWKFAVSPTVASLLTTESVRRGHVSFTYKWPHWLPSTLLGVHRKRPGRILQADSGCSSINIGAHRRAALLTSESVRCDLVSFAYKRFSLVAINVARSAQQSHDLLRFRRPTAVAALSTMEHVRRAGVADHGFTEVT